MKTKYFSLAALALIAGIAFTSCQSSSEKEEAAKDNVEDAQQDLKEVQTETKTEDLKVANAEEWAAFKADAEAKIKENETKIAELKVKLQKPGKILDPLYKDRIETLEKQNIKLKSRIYDYDKTHSDWDAFKREFNHDMDELGNALKDLGVDNKK